jgi:hypothetical protein
MTSPAASVSLAWTTVQEAPGLRVLAVRPAVGTGDALAAWVGDGLSALIAELRAACCEAGHTAPRELLRVAVLVEPPLSREPDDLAAAEALVEGVRGVVGSLTLELRERVRLNAVVAEQGRAGGVPEALAFLARDEAAFVAGATLRVGGSA